MKQGIVAFAWTIPATATGNLDISSKTQRCSNLHGDAPVFAQSVDYMPFPPEMEGLVTRMIEKPGKPASTLRIAREAVLWAKEKNLTRLFIVCAPPHLWRCKRDLMKVRRDAGLENQIFITTYFEVDRVPFDRIARKIYFDPISTQWHTRKPFNWFLWDMAARILVLIRLYEWVDTKIGN